MDGKSEKGTGEVRVQVGIENVKELHAVRCTFADMAGRRGDNQTDGLGFGEVVRSVREQRCDKFVGLVSLQVLGGYSFSIFFIGNI